ncbi:putative PAS/PAC sensor protein [Paracidovorax citrulli AAC00-1]|uniref:PAS/PAC sensor protein n=1 Tax=Paracidovorax citrulli (strain AAC00-1) TaxID=397945 RepID=A1TQ43_PARC0|nr:putative PAS/PAC sensor protein [Paracidovorax citrulli AAC00-1]
MHACMPRHGILRGRLVAGRRSPHHWGQRAKKQRRPTKVCGHHRHLGGALRMLELERFFLLDGADGLPAGALLTGSHDPALVALSVAVAVLSSTLALYLSGQARGTQITLSRVLALTSAGVALGAGIWAMHFIGMLSFTLCAAVHYDVALTMLSMFPGMCASWLALSLLARPEVQPRQLVLGGVLVGAGIGAMHYMGMAAMLMAPLLRYDPLWFIASLVVAVALANAALWVRFMLKRRLGMAPWKANLLGGAIMGCAISGMHYTAMAAARFVGTAEPGGGGGREWVQMMAITVTLVTACVGLFAGAVNGFILYRDLYRQARRSESRLRALVDTAVDGIITIDGRGIIQSFNQSAERIFGWTAGDVLGRNIRMLMPRPTAKPTTATSSATWPPARPASSAPAGKWWACTATAAPCRCACPSAAPTRRTARCSSAS